MANWEKALQAAYTTPKSAKQDDPLVLVQCVEDIFYVCLFGEIIKSLQTTVPVRVEMLVPRSLRTPSEGHGWRFAMRTFGRLLQSNIVTDRKWIRLVGAYADGVAYRSIRPLSLWREIMIARTARAISKRIKTKDELIALAVRGIPIGDLVADTYLRRRPSALLKPDDPFMRSIIRQALRDIDKAFSYFSTRRPALFLTSYTSYIQHGIPVRVATKLGVRTQSFGNYLDFSKKIAFDHSNHQRDFTGYKADFMRLPDQEEKAAQGGAMLAARLSGKIDDGIVYMKKSAYGSQGREIPDVRGALIVFLSDFYDSPHCYEWMVFHDFWEWTCFTIETLRNANIPFFIKQHPNEVSESAADVARLMELYPGLQLLPAGTSNRQLAEGGISCAVTAYGSVTAEMAYMGVPTISSADNPHISFDFGHTAHTKEEYRAMLKAHATLPRDLARLQYEAGAFYYMHFLNLPEDKAEIRDKFIQNNVQNLGYAVNKEWNANLILDGFEDLAATRGFHAFVDELATYVRAAAAASRQS
jgi:hypothetical protein